MRKLIFLFPLLLAACNSFQSRPDPFPAPFDTLNHTLLTEFCGKSETVIGCQLDSEELTDDKFVRIHAPMKGDIQIYGCGIDKKILAEKQGVIDFKLGPVLPVGKRGNCILDFQFNFRVSDNFPRAIRSRIFIDRRGPGQSSPPSFTDQYGHSFQGTAAIKIREGFEGTFQPIRIKTSRTTERGVYEFIGCGGGIKPKEFSGDGFEFDLSELITAPSKKGDCFLFGWAVDGAGLDDSFSMGLTVFGRDDTKLGAHAWVEKKKVCFFADETVSLVVYGDEVSFKLEDCFKAQDEKVFISFYTIQGRALHGSFESGGVVWKD